VDERKRKIAGNCRSDHLMLANVIIDYEMADNKSRFCWDNFLSEATLRLLISMVSSADPGCFFPDLDPYIFHPGSRG
jgi:hypothetical protein